MSVKLSWISTSRFCHRITCLTKAWCWLRHFRSGSRSCIWPHIPSQSKRGSERYTNLENFLTRRAIHLWESRGGQQRGRREGCRVANRWHSSRWSFDSGFGNWKARSHWSCWFDRSSGSTFCDVGHRKSRQTGKGTWEWGGTFEIWFPSRDKGHGSGGWDLVNGQRWE